MLTMRQERFQMGLRARQAQATRDAILAAATDLFAKQGFADTSIADILERTGMARGALYHHFSDKESLFAAVWEATLRRAHQNVISAASKKSDVWEALSLGREAYLDSWTDPMVVRILLIDGPNVLSPDSREQITGSMGSAFRSGALLRASFDALVANGQAEPPGSFEPLVAVLAGAFDAAAMAIATAKDRKRARREIGDALNVLVDGLRAVLSRPATKPEAAKR
jgi:AcrR family transcriptional regulator